MTDALRRANRLAVEGARAEAALIMAETLGEDPRGDAVPSLGFLVSEGLEETVLERCWDHLGGWAALSAFEGAVEVERFPFMALLVEIGLNLDRHRALRFIDDVYIPHMKRAEILRTLAGKTIFFWHVPKCGGTALNTCISRDSTGQACASCHLTPRGASSGRLSMNMRLTSRTSPAHTFCVTIWICRHPIASIRSFRCATLKPAPLCRPREAEDAAPAWRGLEILAPGGPGGMGRARTHRSGERQTATFSASCDPREAAATIESLDLVFDVASLPVVARHLAATFELPLDLELLKTTKNVTNKAITYLPEDIEGLRAALAPDIALHERLCLLPALR